MNSVTIKRGEDLTALNRRVSLAAEYETWGQDYVFKVDGEEIDGHECSQRLTQGAPFVPFFRAIGYGTRKAKRRDD